MKHVTVYREKVIQTGLRSNGKTEEILPILGPKLAGF
jgi:hypothetical protein